MNEKIEVGQVVNLVPAMISLFIWSVNSMAGAGGWTMTSVNIEEVEKVKEGV